MSGIIFDIETGPLDEARIREVVDPFDPTTVKVPGPFDPSTVRYGNMKDEAKRQAKLEDAREKHAKEVTAAEDRLADAEQAYWATTVERAALHAETGQVLAIGFAWDGAKPQVIDGDEADVLAAFWSRVEKCREKELPLIGFNICGFDLPFLVRRSWLCGVKVPQGMLDRGRYWSSQFVDLLDLWRCGNRGDYISLGSLSKSLGVGGKSGSGAEFAKLWATDRPAAVAYLENDLTLTLECARRLGAV